MEHSSEQKNGISSGSSPAGYSLNAVRTTCFRPAAIISKVSRDRSADTHSSKTGKLVLAMTTPIALGLCSIQAVDSTE
ncbi:hypothetical protein G6F67_009717 [Rhizopus microsporus]|nr:hypothetical protein G6F67_009717 [Rhizopus microsporus]